MKYIIYILLIFNISCSSSDTYDNEFHKNINENIYIDICSKDQLAFFLTESNQQITNGIREIVCRIQVTNATFL
jgi:hypothetical protein